MQTPKSLVATVALLLASVSVQTTPAVGASADAAVQEIASPNGIHLQPTAQWQRARLVVAGPNGYRSEKFFDSGDLIEVRSLGSDGTLLPDGEYNFELRYGRSSDSSSFGSPASAPDASGSGAQRAAGALDQVHFGGFVLENGLFRATESDRVRATGGPAKSSLDSALSGGPAPIVHHNDSLTITGRFCVGNADCSAAYTPTDSIEIVDAGIPEITFRDDLQNPSRHWELEASSSNIHFNDVLSGNFNVLAIEEGAPTASLHVDSELGLGKVGLGTSVPASGLHLARDTDITLEEAGVATWRFGTQSDVGDVQFELIDDGTGGSVFDVLVLENNFAPTPSGVAVGVFVGNPEATFHVASPGFDALNGDGSAKILVTETSPVASARELFELQNNGPTIFRVQDTQPGGQVFDFKVTPAGFFINRPGTPLAAFQVNPFGRFNFGPAGSTAFILPNGDMTIGGTLSQNSDRQAKENLEVVSVGEVLAKVRELPISRWNYIDNPDRVKHLGPMAQDFYAAFGLGASRTAISSLDTGGVALAAIQGLIQELERRDQRIDGLEAELARIYDKLTQLQESAQ